MRKVVAVGATIVKLTVINLAFAGELRSSDYDDAREASAIMAAVRVCNTSISEDLRRLLYAKMLKIMRTPSQVNYSIDIEIDALKTLSSSDRAAMCTAIEDRANSMMH